MNIKIKDIHIGFRFCQPDRRSKVGHLYEVIDIKANKHAGRDCNDMWGNKVWEEPSYTVRYKDVQTNEIEGFTVQTDNSDLNWIITPCDTLVKAKELAYKSYRKDVYEDISRGIEDLFKRYSFNSMKDFADMIEKDKELSDIIKYLLKLSMPKVIKI